MDSPFDPSKMTVLLVDDTPANIEVLGSILKPEGYRVAIAGSGDQALKVVKKIKPDLIFLDVMMPGIDGFETCRRLKADRETRDIPVIFITAKTQTEDLVAAFEAGGVDYISKPVREQEVLARARTHLMLRATIDALVTTNEQKSKFLGVAAHDLRNPLAAVIGYMEMMNEDTNDPLLLGYTTKVTEIANDMLTMVNDLLDVSAIESGKFTLNKSRCCLVTLAQEKININKFRANRKNISIECHFEDIDHIYIDPNRLSQVIDNLLSNAIKFSPENATVRVEVKYGDDAAHVYVIDQGPGLSDEDKNRLFGDFQQLSAKPTGGEKTTGLGLAIAKKVVESHGGRIWVESESGRGAKFCVSLPR